MRRSRSATAESRQRIVAEAARMVRQRGPERVSVADVMQAAGMTHGGFYVHFPDKDALMAEATRLAFAQRLDPIEVGAGPERADALSIYLDSYLTLGHVNDPGSGCPIAGLGTDSARGAPLLQDAMAEGIARTIAVLEHALPEQGTDRRADVLRTLVAMVGSVVVSRALTDPELKAEVIETIRRTEPIRSILTTERDPD